MRQFKDDDIGFTSWRDAHPDGFVVNTTRNPNSDYLMLHRTTCMHLHSPDDYPNWIKDYIKIFAADVDALNHWSSRNVSGLRGSSLCSTCRP